MYGKNKCTKTYLNEIKLEYKLISYGLVRIKDEYWCMVSQWKCKLGDEYLLYSLDKVQYDINQRTRLIVLGWEEASWKIRIPNIAL